MDENKHLTDLKPLIGPLCVSITFRLFICLQMSASNCVAAGLPGL